MCYWKVPHVLFYFEVYRKSFMYFQLYFEKDGYKNVPFFT